MVLVYYKPRPGLIRPRVPTLLDSRHAGIHQGGPYRSHIFASSLSHIRRCFRDNINKVKNNTITPTIEWLVNSLYHTRHWTIVVQIWQIAFVVGCSSDEYHYHGKIAVGNWSKRHQQNNFLLKATETHILYCIFVLIAVFRLWTHSAELHLVSAPTTTIRRNVVTMNVTCVQYLEICYETYGLLGLMIELINDNYATRSILHSYTQKSNDTILRYVKTRIMLLLLLSVFKWTLLKMIWS